jgi:PKHD-type hydroxylase
MIRITKLFDKEKALAYRERLASVKFEDGSKTYLGNSEKMKANSEFMPAVEDHLRIDLQQEFFENDMVRKICMPFKMIGPFVNRYSTGDFYGKHCDSVEMQGPSRADISFTLFLSDPDEYADGELEIDNGDTSSKYKLPAGTAIFYPAGSMHQVLPVTEGTRLCAVGWMQSRVKDSFRRNILYELDMVFDEYTGKHGVDDMATSLQSVIVRLKQSWVQY